ncbi:carbonic anhydrase 2-like [Tigriopus californicus]|uniref:carbonic anhydrase 2-like n=1 Tax=Tigriopus californicus TaxID=6832 RepID=UPI0027D9EE9F|nr:carbonic anhydrase 2-like [Tigriopus californicus]|eukprot:TCALIF_11592-PA protein Name:"Similar to ca2 Carbonic anhydrase 2 (Tribolodon hakonensis)" AED:0.08 eAED:0.08 QI:38/1/1/1/0.16/0.28/7/147/278
MLLLLILGACLASTHASPDWDYRDTSQWCDSFPTCCPSSVRQSPIDIIESNAVPQSYPTFEVTFETDGPPSAVEGILSNNGHTVQWSVDTSKNNIELAKGPLGSDTYQLAQFHFHWGRTQRTGSEHALNGKFFPAEVHFVHYNKKYNSLAEAAGKSDGLAVVGIFIEVEEAKSVIFQPIVEAVRDIRTPNTEVLVTLNLEEMLGNVNLEKYTTYKGSLTTPGCNESVTWINLLTPISIGRTDLKFIRLLRETTNKARLVNNYRALQNNQQTLYIRANV